MVCRWVIVPFLRGCLDKCVLVWSNASISCKRHNIPAILPPERFILSIILINPITKSHTTTQPHNQQMQQTYRLKRKLFTELHWILCLKVIDWFISRSCNRCRVVGIDRIWRMRLSCFEFLGLGLLIVFGCLDCFGCFGCFGCLDCFGCFGCFGCFDCFGWFWLFWLFWLILIAWFWSPI